jgi:hypothetical protein
VTLVTYCPWLTTYSSAHSANSQLLYVLIIIPALNVVLNSEDNFLVLLVQKR